MVIFLELTCTPIKSLINIQKHCKPVKCNHVLKLSQTKSTIIYLGYCILQSPTHTLQWFVIEVGIHHFHLVEILQWMHYWTPLPSSIFSDVKLIPQNWHGIRLYSMKINKSILPILQRTIYSTFTSTTKTQGVKTMKDVKESTMTSRCQCMGGFFF